MHGLATIIWLNQEAEKRPRRCSQGKSRPMTYAEAQEVSRRSPFNQANWPGQGVKTLLRGYQDGRH